MVDVLFKVIDYLLKLIELGDKQSERRLKDIYQPLFDALKSVHSDYNVIFGSLLKDAPSRLEAPQLPTDVVRRMARQLSDLRRQFSPIRQQVKGAATALKAQPLSEPASAFVSAVLAYFPTGELVLQSNEQGGASASTAIVKAVYSDLDSGTAPSFDLRDLLEATLSAQESRMQHVSEAYVRLQVSILA